MALVLGDAQQAAIAESTRTLNIWYGSVSGGKTVAWLLMMLGEIATAGPHGAIVIMGKSVDTIYRNVFVPLQELELFAAAREEIRYRKGNTSAMIFGREVHIIGVADMGAEERIRGGTYQKVFYDELTLCPEPVFNMIFTRLRATGNPEPPRMWATTNPDAGTHYLKEKFMNKPDETDTYSRLFTMDDNPTLTEEYKKRTAAAFTGLFYRRFILGEWVAAEGAVYESWDPDTMVVDELPRITQLIATGVDYGTTHPTAGHALGLGEDRRLYIVSEWSPNLATGEHKALTDSMLVEDYQRWENELTKQFGPVRFRYADPAAKSFREEMKHQGVPTNKADNSVLDGINQVASLLSGDQLKIHSSAKNLIREMSEYRWDEKASRRGETKVIKEKDDHVDGFRYVCRSSRHLWRNLVREALTAEPVVA